MTDRSNPWPIVWTPFLERLVRRLTSGRGGVSVGGNFMSGTLTSLLDDGATPATVANVSATAMIQAVWLKWDANSETDLTHYEVWRHTSDDSASASKIMDTYTTAIVDGDITVGQIYYYWVKAVDHKGNTSGFSSSVNATPFDVRTIDIVDTAVTEAKLADLAVTLAKLAANAVSSDKIVDLAVTEAKLDANAVTLAKVAANAVDSSKIVDLAVTEAKLAALSVSLGKLAADSVDKDKLTVPGVDADGKLVLGQIGSGDASDITGAATADKLALIASSMLPNWRLDIADLAGRPAGIYPVANITDFSGLDWLDSGKTEINIAHASDIMIGYGFPAIPIDDKQKYKIVIRHKAPVASESGLYLRLEQYNASLPVGKTHIGDEFGGTNAQERSNIVDLASNRAFPGTSWEVDEYTYTPTAGTKYASFAMYNWSDAGTKEYHVDYVLMYVIPKTADEVDETGSRKWAGETGADVTGSNTAANVTGQGALATLSTVDTAQIDNNAITAAKILAGEIGTGHLAALAVTAGKIAALAIETGKLAANAVTAAKIAAGTITATEIAALTIAAGNIAANAIETGKINALAVTADKIAANTITAAKIAAGTITTTEIAALTIAAGDIAANAITTAKINALAVDTDKLAANAVTADKIAANTITAAKIAAETITATEIAALTITAGLIQADAIITNKINGLAVTTGKIADEAVTIPSSSYVEGVGSGVIGTLDITTTGLALFVHFSCVAAIHNDTTSRVVSWRLFVKRDAVEVYSTGTLQKWLPTEGYYFSLHTFSFQDEPSGGSYTYTVTLQVLLGNMLSDATRRFLYILEIKK